MRTDTALSALVVAAVLGGASLIAAPAYAADEAAPIGIGRVVTESGQRGAFTVAAWTDVAGNQVTSVTAKVLDGDREGAVLAEPTLTAVGEQWVTGAGDDLLKLTEDGGTMPRLGRYDVEVTATDSQGDTVTRTEPGALDFTLTPKFAAADGTTANPGALMLDPAVLDVDHTTETTGGVLLGVQPGSGDLVPLAGRTVTVDMTYPRSSTVLTSQSAVTDADGRFRAAFAVSGAVGFDARFSEDSGVADGAASVGDQPATYRSTPSAVTAAASAKRVLPGQAFTVSGVVHATSSATSPGVAGVPVSAGFSSTGAARTTAVTDSAGHFSVTLLGDPESDGTWDATITQPLRSGRATGSVIVPDDSSFAGLVSSVSADDRVTVSGKLLRTYHRDQYTGSQNVGLWYSPDGKTGWKGLAGVNLDYTSTFKISTYGYLDGYYQVRHATSDQLVASAGPIVHLTRTNTRIFQMYANTARVKKNATLTLTGNLKAYIGKVWKPYAGQYVELYFQPKGSTKWTYLAYGRTDAAGRAKFTHKATQDGKWLIQYFGDGTHYDSDAAGVFVDVV
ncbi:hypothetical protein [Streptomyces sp. NBC_01190]|uniref:hypothetical protein n=1 Tax=Streptomyces sp. NBC_01190 TaxID=2903767 RepID=UPI003869E7E7|nr:hypothetical protein OG519_19915 [Streptomyces sp. NBC_01190]